MTLSGVTREHLRKVEVNASQEQNATPSHDCVTDASYHHEPSLRSYKSFSALWGIVPVSELGPGQLPSSLPSPEMESPWKGGG